MVWAAPTMVPGGDVLWPIRSYRRTIRLFAWRVVVTICVGIAVLALGNVLGLV